MMNRAFKEPDDRSATATPGAPDAAQIVELPLPRRDREPDARQALPRSALAYVLLVFGAGLAAVAWFAPPPAHG